MKHEEISDMKSRILYADNYDNCDVVALAKTERVLTTSLNV